MRRAGLYMIGIGLGAALLLSTPVRAAEPHGAMDLAPIQIEDPWSLAPPGQRTAFAPFLTAASECPANLCKLSGFSRDELGGGIAHYGVTVRVGPGAFDQFRLHRVVREARPYFPARSKNAVFTIHGDLQTWEGVYLMGAVSDALPAAQSFAYFLASNGIDVWGMDLGWILVPEDVGDLGFMEEWGFDRDLADLEVALRLTRKVRWLTGSGNRKVNLLGYSRGGFHAFAHVNRETQLRAGERHVKGLISVDSPYKTDFEPTRQVACALIAQKRAQVAAGEFADGSGSFLNLVSLLARTDPNGPSPIPDFAGLTNEQVALLVGGATHVVFPFTPWFHWVAADFVQGFPFALRYTMLPVWEDFLAEMAPYEPNRMMFESILPLCGEEENPYDDHLAEIRVPLLVVGVAGGLGVPSQFNASIVGSRDVTVEFVQLEPPEGLGVDFGHIDLITAWNAQALVWQPVLDWIEAH